ncbi:AraC family transcriptional regulator [Membranicola marinus]|uniref:AraC family transcriptional regulator n=1 Tax=Membranihabitans marinus TaxID=1227546 RepID=A0A953L7E2_9BACT|nr:AraC family transcriptional regulator [Membranihabitans marinus]MBY5956505.1 AraC family transcriptional regulator [Membranihabitans marinus]
MNAVELHLPQDFTKSFVVFREKGAFFPAPWHYHEHYELVLVKKSTGRRMVGDHIGYFDEGDLVFMGSMLPHVWVNDPEYFEGEADQEADALVIHFTKDFLGEGTMKMPEMEKLKKVLKLSQRGMAIKGKARAEIDRLMTEMPEMPGLLRMSNLFAVFQELAHAEEVEILASPAFVQNYESLASDRFKSIMEYIMQNFDQKITLEQVSGVANMSVTAFSNYFKDQFRMTFVEYLNSVRIGQVCVLMSETDKNISEIAYNCGFNNLANFNRQFKKHKGMTPRQYRKKLEAGL